MPEYTHPELLDLAYPYALDALSDADRRAVEQLLSSADDTAADAFRATVHDIRETMATMTVVDAHPAPPEVEAALHRALDQRSGVSGSGVTDPIPLRPRRSRSVRWLAAAAALVAVLALGATVAVYRSDAPGPSTVTAEQVRTHSDTRAATIEVAGGGTITINASRDLNTATVSFAAVPTAPTGHTYQLWRISQGAQPQSVGVLDTLPTERAPMLMRLDNAAQVALSIEPTGGSNQPTTGALVAVPVR